MYRSLVEPVGEEQFLVRAPSKDGKIYLQPYQKTVSYLVHPERPVSRLLVSHRTGAGKTLTLIKVRRKRCCDISILNKLLLKSICVHSNSHLNALHSMYSTVKVLDNFYDDVRPKVVIFPNSALVTNFYSELEKFQNIPGCKHAQFAERYLDFFDRQRQYPEVTGFLTVIFLL